MAHQTSVPLLVGSYTSAGSQGIYVYQFNLDSGRLSLEPSQVVAAGNPSWLTLSADRQHLYAVNENGPGQADIVGRVTAFAVDPDSGHLRTINQVSSLGSEPTYASLSHDGRYLLVANYSVAADPGGTLAVIPLATDGRLLPAVQVKTHRASQVDPERQSSPHVHSVLMSPDGQFVLAVDLGADRIYVYRYDPVAQPEAPLQADPHYPAIELPAGSGPRHLIFSADGKHAYVTLEMSGQVAVFDYAAGRLQPRQVLALAEAGASGQNGAGGLHLSADGRYLYVVNRGSFNQLVVFAVDPASGQLSLRSRHPVGGQNPREFAIDPSGHYLLVANQGSNHIVVFRRDPVSGAIGDQVQSLPFSQPADFKFLGP